MGMFAVYVPFLRMLPAALTVYRCVRFPEDMFNRVEFIDYVHISPQDRQRNTKHEQREVNFIQVNSQ